ncbi:3-keto-5-aminohexanoate cleavage protein [Deinococcus piscis]|uniref:3-keto-5-aminohexanoate cleavage protein n=1 Tax=Deinococcus piscis TaxID=394230 RepID=UPI003570DC06
MEAATWPVLRRAAALGLGSRIGFADTSLLPDQRPASNLELYRAAVRLMAQV